MNTILREECRKRRNRLLARMSKSSIAILRGVKENVRERPDDYPFDQLSDFYYLTGFTELNAVAVFVPYRQEGEYILFNAEREKTKELWFGELVGQERAVKEYDADQSFSINQMDSVIPDLLLGKKRIYFDINRGQELDEQVFSWLKKAKNKARIDTETPEEFVNVESIVHELRLIKSRYEIELIRKSAALGVSAHQKAMTACRDGLFEYQIEAELRYQYMQNAGAKASFNPIVASGANACIIHYANNNAKLRDGNLVLIDAGVKFNHYCSDISRTIPVNKKFTSEQRAIYEAVLETQLRVIDKIRPGLSFNELDKTGEKIIGEKLLSLGLLQGTMEELIEQKLFKRFYPHRISHWLGLDTHDVGRYIKDGRWRKLEPGMVLTIEPGVYIRAQSEGVDEKWWNIGIRIEDMVLVTETGKEVLTAQLPKSVTAIEKMK